LVFKGSGRMNKEQEYFVVMRLHRDDLKQQSIKGKFSDSEMKWIAEKLGELYCETDFWTTLEDLCKDVKERRK